MTGLYPHEMDQWDNLCELGNSTPPFARAFHSAGYDTVISGRMHFAGWDQLHGFAERLVGDLQESSYLAASFQLQKVLGDLADTPGMRLAGIMKSGPGRAGYHAYDETVTRATVELACVRWVQ